MHAGILHVTPCNTTRYLVVPSDSARETGRVDTPPNATGHGTENELATCMQPNWHATTLRTARKTPVQTMNADASHDGTLKETAIGFEQTNMHAAALAPAGPTVTFAMKAIRCNAPLSLPRRLALPQPSELPPDSLAQSIFDAASETQRRGAYTPIFEASGAVESVQNELDPLALTLQSFTPVQHAQASGRNQSDSAVPTSIKIKRSLIMQGSGPPPPFMQRMQLYPSPEEAVQASKHLFEELGNFTDSAAPITIVGRDAVRLSAQEGTPLQSYTVKVEAKHAATNSDLAMDLALNPRIAFAKNTAGEPGCATTHAHTLYAAWALTLAQPPSMITPQSSNLLVPNRCAELRPTRLKGKEDAMKHIIQCIARVHSKASSAAAPDRLVAAATKEWVHSYLHQEAVNAAISGADAVQLLLDLSAAVELATLESSNSQPDQMAALSPQAELKQLSAAGQLTAQRLAAAKTARDATDQTDSASRKAAEIAVTQLKEKHESWRKIALHKVPELIQALKVSPVQQAGI